MALSLLKKPKATKPAGPPLPSPLVAEPPPSLTPGLDLANHSTRTAIGWITDGSPSMTGFTDVQLESAKSMVGELCRLPSTAQSVMLGVVQIGTPPVGTGFQEIARFQVPPLHASKSTPFHLALDRMAGDLGALFSEFRTGGIERTDSVVVITTDGFANGATAEELGQSVQRFLDLGKKWSVTNLVVGVGAKLNEELLKKLANVIPPLHIEELNAACLMPFIQKIAQRVSQSRRGQKIELELPDGIETIE